MKTLVNILLLIRALVVLHHLLRKHRQCRKTWRSQSLTSKMNGLARIKSFKTMIRYELVGDIWMSPTWIGQ